LEILNEINEIEAGHASHSALLKSSEKGSKHRRTRTGTRTTRKTEGMGILTAWRCVSGVLGEILWMTEENAPE
jgi:hypothetical protein